MVFIQENVHLLTKLTFGINTIVSYFVSVRNINDIKEAINFARKKDIPYVIISGGSNTLFYDEYFDGLVIEISSNEIFVRKKDEFLEVVVDAGVELKKFVEFVSDKGFRGVENLYGIPGSVGGAVRGNAGAFGIEISDNLEYVNVFDVEKDKVIKINKKDCRFSYRDSLFKTNKNLIILNASFVFKEKDNPENILKDAKNILKERERRHIQNVKAAGSFFKNPVAPQDIVDMFEKDKNTKSRGGRVPAGWLIEKVGLKGKIIGGAMCSNQHPNYIINYKNAIARDVIELSELIKKKVKDKFRIELEEEVQIFYSNNN